MTHNVNCELSVWWQGVNSNYTKIIMAILHSRSNLHCVSKVKIKSAYVLQGFQIYFIYFYGHTSTCCKKCNTIKTITSGDGASLALTVKTSLNWKLIVSKVHCCYCCEYGVEKEKQFCCCYFILLIFHITIVPQHWSLISIGSCYLAWGKKSNPIHIVSIIKSWQSHIIIL